MGLWMIFVVSFLTFMGLSMCDSINIGGQELRSSRMADALTLDTLVSGPALPVKESDTDNLADKNKIVAEVDTAPKTILFIGDSMLEGLSPRLAAYCEENGHTLYSVIWYSSTSEVWGGSGKLSEYIGRLHPDYIFICLGANELFVKDIAEKRDRYVKRLVEEIGDIPFVWIGPPNWKPDTGINDLIAGNVPAGSFFLSNGMKFDRSKDGAHPTRSSAALWMDSVARWMPDHSRHPILLDLPKVAKGKPKRIFVHQPSER